MACTDSAAGTRYIRKTQVQWTFDRYVWAHWHDHSQEIALSAASISSPKNKGNGCLGKVTHALTAAVRCGCLYKKVLIPLPRAPWLSLEHHLDADPSTHNITKPHKLQRQSSGPIMLEMSAWEPAWEQQDPRLHYTHTAKTHPAVSHGWCIASHRLQQ